MLSRKSTRATIAVGAGGTAQSPAHLNYNVSTNVGTYTNKLSVETWNASTISCSTMGATAMTGQTITLGQLGGPWTSRTSATDNSWYAVTYGNGLFVAVAGSGTGNRVMTSPDGITWTSRTSAADNSWSSVTYGNGLFVVVADKGSGNRVMTSPDGITWTSRTSATDNQWQGVTWGNGLFVAVAVSGTGNRVMTSPDGITWTSRTSAADNNWSSITYGNGLFVAVSSDGTGNRVMTWNGSAGSITCGQVVSPIIQGPTGYNLSLEAGGTGYSLTSMSVYNTTTASSANVAITGTTGMFQRFTSSIRYKTDVEDLSLADAEKVWDMRPVWYRSTCRHDRKDWSYYGMIAEEVAAIDPRVCFWDENGQVEGVMYDRIVPMFLRTQKEEYAKMTLEIGDLKDRVLRL